MQRTALQVTRLPYMITPDSSRVITRFFCPGDEVRIRRIIERILALADSEVQRLLAEVKKEFGERHKDLDGVFADNYESVTERLTGEVQAGERQRALIGAYFTMEYAIESAALFNPSMVPAFDQDGAPDGTTRFLMSLRATGEGHISSIVFRRGIVDRDNKIHIDPPSPQSRQLKIVEDRSFEKQIYWLKLIEMGAHSDLAETVLGLLAETFTVQQLREAIEHVRQSLESPETLQETADNMLTLAHSNYMIRLHEGTDPSEVVIFPTSENESRGIEDVRLVLFTDDDGGRRYYGTYTAYNGFRIVPQILEISPERVIKVHTINGLYAQNKGMALFPRKIRGLYLMISRLDNENLFLMTSDNVRFWNQAELIQAPKYPWEFIQIGNCGSPLETRDGWLLLTHGVGPMRQYCIGATLLDLQDPSKMIGQLAEPLLVPVDYERIGYVPNVVYTCGGMIHQDRLIVPYAMSDYATGFATVSLPDLLNLLKSQS